MLEEYRKKRDFSRTREPAPAPSDAPEAGAGPAGKAGGGSLRFVVQKHAASRLHYDFRLELDGVLKSWAVPKGPSADPREKRLAVHVEDHPLEYAAFEGVIAHGNYGGGQVIVWDRGAYSPDEGGLSFGRKDESEERMRRDLEKGKLSFTLRGRKLKGSWTLVRTARSPKDWLLIKHRDEHVDSEGDLTDLDRSVQSGLTLEDLKEGRLPDPSAVADTEALGEPGPFPARMKPMLARTADKPFSHPEWLFEPKLDGHRVLAFIRDGKATLLSRNGNDLTSAVPAIAEELAAQPEAELVLDGELVALDSQGRPDFGLLQQAMHLEPPPVDPPETPATLVYYPFDLLYADGRDLRRAPLSRRKTVLNQVLVAGERVRRLEYVEGDGEAFYRAASGLGLEGMVAKKRDGIYEPGHRSASWLKVKGVQEHDFVIGGYTPGTGHRASTFGSLVVGYHDGGALKYAGRVGSGFDAHALKALKDTLDAIPNDASPFAPDPELDAAKAAWVRPVLVARVKFAEWTHGGRLRAPVYLGLRPDVDAGSVTRPDDETPAPLRGQTGAESPPTAQGEHPPQADDDVPTLLEQLSGNQDKLLMTVSGHRIGLTNLNKVLWPDVDAGGPYTKRDLIRHYLEVSGFLLPHLKDRPLTFTRYPNGIDGGSFYQKHADRVTRSGAGRPDFVETVRMFSSSNEGDGDFIMANNLPTLVWLAQLASIELHPWLSRVAQFPDAAQLPTAFTGSKEAMDASVLNYPDFIVFDLDPYIYSGEETPGAEPDLNRRAFSKTVEVARELKDVLDQLSLSSFVKTSGKTGLHVYVPILRQYDYPVTRSTCELIGRFLMRRLPRDVTMEWTVGKRAGKIFLDHNQNVRSKNMASIYSLRPAPNAPVSTPLRWEELDRVYPTDFTVKTLPQRLSEVGDLWAGILAAKHDLRRLLEAAAP